MIYSIVIWIRLYIFIFTWKWYFPKGFSMFLRCLYFKGAGTAISRWNLGWMAGSCKKTHTCLFHDSRLQVFFVFFHPLTKQILTSNEQWHPKILLTRLNTSDSDQPTESRCPVPSAPPDTSLAAGTEVSYVLLGPNRRPGGCFRDFPIQTWRFWTWVWRISLPFTFRMCKALGIYYLITIPFLNGGVFLVRRKHDKNTSKLGGAPFRNLGEILL